MKRKNQKQIYVSVCLFITFVLWTLLVKYVDVKAIGPNESVVGLATLNEFVHEFTGINLLLYSITDWLSLIPFGLVLVFASLGVKQWHKRKKLLKVDVDILILGIYFLIVLCVYIFFENFTVNYRPVLIDGKLEGSYPSSTTMLVLCVIPTVIMQVKNRIKHKMMSKVIVYILVLFMSFMVICRLISGVHWFSDIIGGILLSASLIFLYLYTTRFSSDN